jgi:hypothetical protein
MIATSPIIVRIDIGRSYRTRVRRRGARTKIGIEDMAIQMIKSLFGTLCLNASDAMPIRESDNIKVFVRSPSYGMNSPLTI